MVDQVCEAKVAWKGLFEPLLVWYSREKRDLPWRNTQDPYAILVSEVMLQQTRVETVIAYYARFLERFPTALSLANASLEEVYEEWAGLGYYRRAKSLWQAAQVLQRGPFPNCEQDLRQLPGVGDYTAAALTSIAFGRPAVALDGNAIRVLSRVYGLEGEKLCQQHRQDLKQRTLPQIPPSRAGDFTQAVMELGARVCLPRQPRCQLCPMHDRCRAFLDQTIGEQPRPSPGRSRQPVELVALRLRREDKVWLERRAETPFLAHQWVPPWFASAQAQEMERYRAEFPGSRPELIAVIEHAITYRDLSIQVWEWEVQSVSEIHSEPGGFFESNSQRFPAFTRKILTAKVRESPKLGSD